MSDACPVVRIMPSHPSQGAFVEINESDFDATRHAPYVAPPPPPAVPALPPPPPPPFDPLAGLPREWKGWTPTKLRTLAEQVTGRTAENKEQAVQMIEAALARK